MKWADICCGLLLISLVCNMIMLLNGQHLERQVGDLQNQVIVQEAEAVGLRLKALDFEISAVNFIQQNQEYFLGLGCTAFDETEEQIDAKMSVLPDNIGRGGKR